MTVASTDVPNVYDVVFTLGGSSYGFILSNAVDQRADYGYTPTFVSRTNVSGAYGDNQQDFFLTASQKDWSLGEQQKYLRVNDTGSARQFWQGTNIDVRTPGQVTLRAALKSATFPAAVVALCEPAALFNQNLYAATLTNGYSVDAAGTVTNLGAHGATVPTASQYCMASDGNNFYIGGTAVRKWVAATGVFGAFSATAATSLEYMNNTLFGYDAVTSKLYSFDTVGTATTLFQWKDADGGTENSIFGRIQGFGGQLMIVRSFAAGGSDVWLYDGSGTKRIYQLPKNFFAYDCDVVEGIVFIAGSYVQVTAGDTTDFTCTPAIHYYSSGTTGKLWQSTSTTHLGAGTALQVGYHPALAAVDGGLLFNDDSTARLMFYNLATGGVHCIGSYTIGGGIPVLASSQRHAIHARNQVTGYVYPDTTTTVASGTLISSLIDFDNSLTKDFRTVSFSGTIPTGATVDIAYQLDSLDGSWTTLQSSAAVNTDYTVNQSGHAIAFRFTLNKGSSTAGPTLTRLNLRASPRQLAYRTGSFVFDCSGRDGKTPVILRNGASHPKDGLQQAQDLVTLATAGPVTAYDRFGSFTAVVVAEDFELIEVRPDEFLAKVHVRGV